MVAVFRTVEDPRVIASAARTVEAVKRYQKTYAAEILDPEGLSSPSGIFGPSSVKKANRLLQERRQ